MINTNSRKAVVASLLAGLALAITGCINPQARNVATPASTTAISGYSLSAGTFEKNIEVGLRKEIMRDEHGRIVHDRDSKLHIAKQLQEYLRGSEAQHAFNGILPVEKLRHAGGGVLRLDVETFTYDREEGRVHMKVMATVNLDGRAAKSRPYDVLGSRHVVFLGGHASLRSAVAHSTDGALNELFKRIVQDLNRGNL